jgi:light-regulated signal transduction histidine kinase (bacteriophytochrome)
VEIEGTEAVFPFTSSVIICGDWDHLQQVIWNFLTNAIKFTPQGGNVEIRLDQITISNPEAKNYVSCGCREHQQPRFRKYAQIQVIDNGISITPDFPPYVFDRFSQADSSSTRSHGGLGLGLALVGHLVELHGGTVDVESSGKNQGATFTVRLLLLEESRNVEDQKYREGAEKSLSVSLDSSISLPQIAGIRVLVVHDEANTRQFIRTVLEECQAEVTVVASASEAL